MRHFHVASRSFEEILKNYIQISFQVERNKIVVMNECNVEKPLQVLASASQDPVDWRQVNFFCDLLRLETVF